MTSSSTASSATSAFGKMITLTALVATLLPLTSAHSWVEEYQVISDNGSYVGARGFARGFMGRADPGFDGNSDMWMLPALSARNNDGTVRVHLNASDSVCHPAQRTANYTSTYPKLKVKPGDYVAMKYLENGHVSLPWNITGKPEGTGTVFVFGTTQPSDDEKIVDVLNWNTDGTGGNKRGFLMTAQNFDDGRCTQINCGSISEQRQMLDPNHVAGQPDSTFESWCETDLKIPDSIKAGTLTTYWLWQWPTEPNRDCNNPGGKDEWYTTCADFDIVDDGTANKLALAASFTAAAGENPRSVAVSGYKSRTAYTTQAAYVSMSGNKLVGNWASVNSAFASACSAQAPVVSANSLALWPEVYVPTSCDAVTTFGSAAASSALAKFNQAASSYSAQATSAWSAAFVKANMAVPSQPPWSQAPQTGALMNATSAPASMATSAPAYASSSAAAPSSSAATSPASSSAGGAVTNVYTVTTILTITSTLPAGETAPSAAPVASSTSAPVPAPVASSASSAAADMYSTLTTVAVPSVAPNGSVGYRRHARDFAV